MTYIRTGICNQCGECCGYPRSTDGGQNNPWPKHFPESIKDWTKDDIESNLPLFKIIEYPNNKINLHGISTIGNKKCFWIWIQNHGLCTDMPPYGDSITYDQRCPFLSEKLSDNTVPCLLYSTYRKFVWDKLCQPVPPDKFETLEQVEKWFINCPSCSYIYIKE